MAYQQWTPDEAVQQLQGKGYNADTAHAMVRAHLDAGTARYGEPAGGWRVDEYDLAEIERRATEQAPENLAAAVRAVVADYRDGQGNPEASLAEAIASTRSDLDHDDIAGLTDPTLGEPLMDETTAAAYRAVLNADATALDAVIQDVARTVGEPTPVEVSRGIGSGEVAASQEASAADTPPSWMGGPATSPQDWQGATSTAGRGAGYDGPYASDGRFAEELEDLRVTGDPRDYAFGSASDDTEGPLDPSFACAIAAAAATSAAAREPSSDQLPQSEQDLESTRYAAADS